MNTRSGALGAVRSRWLPIAMAAGAILWLVVFPPRIVLLDRDSASNTLLALSLLAWLPIMGGLVARRDEYLDGLSPLSTVGFAVFAFAFFVLPLSSLFLVFVTGALVVGALLLAAGWLAEPATRGSGWRLLGSVLVSVLAGLVGSAVTSSSSLMWMVGAACVIIPFALIPPVKSS